MNVATFKDALLNHKIIAILRGVPADQIVPLVEALDEGGIKLVEVSLSEADSLASLRRLVEFGPKHMYIGAGTVISRSLAEQALGAGATYFVTPHIVPEVADFAIEKGIPLITGAMTPTEIRSAFDHGACFVKVFPAGVLGPAYFRQLQGPYPGLELIAVGGVGQDNMIDFIKSGAVGVGIGGALTSIDWNLPDWDDVRSTARKLVDVAVSPSIR